MSILTGLLGKFRNYFITWPTPLKAQETANILEARYGFPGVIGMVDGTHIPISAPKIDKQAYINRKGFHSIQLQVLCNEKHEFIHCYVGLPGSVHDNRVFRYSGVQQKCNDEYFPENTHLLGDKAYTRQKHLMTPFIDNGHLTVEETHYNYVHSSTRMTIERAIGLLKLHWRYFKNKLPMRRTDLIPHYIMAAYILHNIGLKRQDYFENVDEILLPDEVDDVGPLDATNESKAAGAAKRENL
ncbi:hypothetical protein PV328_008421 [Microctonus aethiopoides]|uniref:DDE Tnp4 domain-containing protein n=1 Tax=Microctonus aethiopoides TaxID=144406 RepID=A0AA39FJR7_9HYME|nr:hypothetical protein PV328_008421 [Microctonus aethiopoides]